MLRFVWCGLTLCFLGYAPIAAQSQSRSETGRSSFVPQLKFELLDDSFAIGAIAGDAAHEARFEITATTGGMRAGDGTFGEKMVGFRVPVPQIVEGGAGLFGVAGDDAEGAPRVRMTQPLTDENGVARGLVVSGMRQDAVRLAYAGASLPDEEATIQSLWNDDPDSWNAPRILALDKANAVTYRMSLERDGKQLAIRGHEIEFTTSGLAGQLWRRDFGPDLDGDGRPDGDYIAANFMVPNSEASVLSPRLFAPEFNRLTRWQPRVTRGEAGVYEARVTARYDPRFVIDSLRTHVWDNNAYEVTGELRAFNSPRPLQLRPWYLEKFGPPAPANWDRATVARLLRDIEKPRNAALLRGLYFGARRSHALPVEAGRKLLDAAAQAKPQSRRWFLLMSLRGFAELRAGEANSAAAGFAAYRALFDNAGKASAARAQTVVRAAIADFVNAAPIAYGQYKLSGVSGENAATIAAWKAYSQSQNWPRSAAERAAQPLWALKWEDGIPSALPLYIARQSAVMTGANMPRASLDWRFAAASALAAGNQQQAAFSLWKPLKDELGAGDLDRLNIVYTRLMEHASWLASSRANSRGGKGLPAEISWEEAAVRRGNLAQERTQRWNFGWAERLDSAPHGAAQMRIVRQLLARPHDQMTENEIMRAISQLFRRAFDLPSDINFERGAANAMGVLARGFLARPEISRAHQWETRFLLATLLERLERRPEASEVLAVPFGPAAKAKDADLWKRVQNARRAVATAAPLKPTKSVEIR